VHGLDDAIAGLGDGGLLLALLAALLLGLRHATDPDHLTAVSTLVLSDEPGQARRASLLGLSWGLGHATTLLAIGLPLILLDRQLPAPVQRGAELAVGLVIVALALRLLVRWRRGELSDGRSAPGDGVPYGVGLLHGVGGSAGVGVLLIGGIASGSAAAALALLLFASASALSMAAVSGGFGYALTLGAAPQALERAIPLLAVASLAFGAWYAAGAL
jgi:hypothetical protein